jgi:hypothetical protein
VLSVRLEYDVFRPSRRLASEAATRPEGTSEPYFAGPLEIDEDRAPSETRVVSTDCGYELEPCAGRSG